MVNYLMGKQNTPYHKMINRLNISNDAAFVHVQIRRTFEAGNHYVRANQS